MYSSTQNFAQRDSYGIKSLDELISNQLEWRNVNDTVRLAIRQLFEAFKHQTDMLRDIERLIQTRVPKSEFISQLSCKANLQDISRILNDVTLQVESKISIEEFQIVLKEYVTRGEFQQSTRQYASQNDIQRSLEERILKFQGDIQQVDTSSNKFEELRNEMVRRFANMVTFKELDQFTREIDNKVSRNELQELLESKASRQWVQQAMQTKINRSEVEALTARKIEMIDFQQITDKLIQERSQNWASLQLVSNLQNNFQQQLVKLENLETDVYGISAASDEKYKNIVQILSESYQRNFESLQNQMNQKLNKLDGDKYIQTLERKVSEDQFQTALKQINFDVQEQQNYLKQEFIQIKRQLNEQNQDKIKKIDQQYALNFEKSNDQITKLREGFLQGQDERRQDIEDLQRQIRIQKKDCITTVERIQQSLEILKRNTEETQTLRALEINDMNRRIDQQFESKVDFIEFQNAMNIIQNDLTSKILQYRQELSQLIHSHDEELLSLISKKANQVETTVALGQKVEQTTLTAALRNLITISEFEEANKLTETLADDLQKKCEISDFKEFSQRVSILLEDMNKQIETKAVLQDVRSILDQKSNHEDVSKAFQEVQRELSRRANLEDFRTLQQEQLSINETLCSENIVGRWTYKSGPLCTGSLIPWNIQNINTLPENYLWEKDKSNIWVVAPGLYEITLGFYAKKKPKVDILVNGDVIMTAVNSGSYVIHHSSGKLKDVKQGSGYITGLTMIDFIVLQSRSRINIAYQGDLGEGFLGLRRL